MPEVEKIEQVKVPFERYAFRRPAISKAIGDLRKALLACNLEDIAVSYGRAVASITKATNMPLNEHNPMLYQDGQRQTLQEMIAGPEYKEVRDLIHAFETGEKAIPTPAGSNNQRRGARSSFPGSSRR